MGNCNCITASEQNRKKENVMTINLTQQIHEIANIEIDEKTQAAIDAPFFNSRNSDLLFRHCLRVCGIEKEDKSWNKDSQ